MQTTVAYFHKLQIVRARKCGRVRQVVAKHGDRITQVLLY